MRKILLIAMMASLCMFYGVPGQAEEQREEKAFPALRVVRVETDEGPVHSLMLGEHIIHKYDSAYLVEINSIFNFGDAHVVLMQEYSDGKFCPLLLHFITIPSGYSPQNSVDVTVEMGTGPWWKMTYKGTYHWLLSLIGLDTPAETSRITTAQSSVGTPQKIVISEDFGSCSNLFYVVNDEGFFGDQQTLSVLTKGFIGPLVEPEDITDRMKQDRLIRYIPGTNKIHQEYLK